MFEEWYQVTVSVQLLVEDLIQRYSAKVVPWMFRLHHCHYISLPKKHSQVSKEFNWSIRPITIIVSATAMLLVRCC
jgi:hypothetical protein